MSRLLPHLRLARTPAEIVRLSGLPYPEVVAELRRLGRAVETIKPTTIHDRAIRYRATNDPDPVRDPARAQVRAQGLQPDRYPDPTPLPVDLAQPCGRDTGEDDRDDRGSETQRAAAGLAERTHRVQRAMVAVELSENPELDSLISAIRRALADGAYRTVSAITAIVCEHRGKTRREAVDKAMRVMYARRFLRKLPSGPAREDLRVGGAPSQAWALSVRGQAWKGSLHVMARKRAVLALLTAAGPLTTNDCEPVMVGLTKNRWLGILLELRKSGEVASVGATHVADDTGRLRPAHLWAAVGAV
jgi:hypothetical protein